MLLHTAPVSGKRALDEVRWSLSPAAELGRGFRPRLPVAGQAVGAELRAERDQGRELGYGLDGPVLGDPDEAVRVEIVPEQERRVPVGGSEQAGTPVMEQVALVDRLEAERVPLVGERREDGLRLELVLRPQGIGPEPALRRGRLRDGLPDVERYSQPASSFVQ